MKTTITLNTITTSIATAMALNKSFTKNLGTTAKAVEQMEATGKQLLIQSINTFSELMSIKPTVEIPTLSEKPTKDEKIAYYEVKEQHTDWAEAHTGLVNTLIISDDFDVSVSKQGKELMGSFSGYLKNHEFFAEVIGTEAVKGFNFAKYVDFKSLSDALSKIIKKEKIDKKELFGDDVWELKNLNTDKKNEKFTLEWDKVTNPTMAKVKANAEKGNFESESTENISKTLMKQRTAKKKEELGLSVKDRLPQEIHNALFMECVVEANKQAEANRTENEKKIKALKEAEAKKEAEDLEGDLK